MFESPPYKDCPSCKRIGTYGILLIYADHYSRRCKICRHSASYSLPSLDKKVIYLDQLVMSNMLAADSGKQSPHFDFYNQLKEKVSRVVTLQQAVFPDSDIHLSESVLSRSYQSLKSLHERFSGGVSFTDHLSIQRSQLQVFAAAWIQNRGIPEISFEIDSILSGDRNAWLEKFIISVNMNYEHLTDEIRKTRDTVAEGHSDVFERWKQDKPAFEASVKNETMAYGKTILELIANNIQSKIKLYTGEGDLSLNDFLNEANIIYSHLESTFLHYGVEQKDILPRVSELLLWDGLAELPFNRISGHLYAALAKQAAEGRNNPPTQGMANDISIISTYAPYCDAMFLDKECAHLLSQNPLKSRLNYNAKIFSLNNKSEFLTYLDDLISSTDRDVQRIADELYNGVLAKAEDKNETDNVT